MRLSKARQFDERRRPIDNRGGSGVTATDHPKPDLGRKLRTDCGKEARERGRPGVEGEAFPVEDRDVGSHLSVEGRGGVVVPVDEAVIGYCSVVTGSWFPVRPGVPGPCSVGVVGSPESGQSVDTTSQVLGC